MRFVERIEAQADILNQQIQDLIQLARVESAQTAFEIIKIDLQKLCQQCVDMFASQAKSLKVELSLQRFDGTLEIEADYEAVRTIINNLISNALHYTPQRGSVTVMLTQDLSLIHISEPTRPY